LKHHLIQPRVERARGQLESALKDGGRHMVGVTKYVDPDPRPAPVEVADPVDALLRHGALTPVRFAAPFEIASEEASQ
ncbi:MAG: methylmalonyl-CoA mutase family protein, partial [Brevundimonas sp.]